MAGSLPLHWRWYEGGLGDYENANLELLDVATDMELYVLGSAGEGRRQVQILNKYDTCCYAFPSEPAYVDVVKDAVAALGAGQYDFRLDDTAVFHGVSPCALTKIEADIAPITEPESQPAH